MSYTFPFSQSITTNCSGLGWSYYLWHLTKTCFCFSFSKIHFIFLHTGFSFTFFLNWGGFNIISLEDMVWALNMLVIITLFDNINSNLKQFFCIGRIECFKLIVTVSFCCKFMNTSFYNFIEAYEFYSTNITFIWQTQIYLLPLYLVYKNKMHVAGWKWWTLPKTHYKNKICMWNNSHRTSTEC